MKLEVQIEKVYELYRKLGELNSKMGFKAKHGLMMLSDLRPHLKVYGLYGKLGELNSKMGFRAKHGLMMLSGLRPHLFY